MCGGSSQSTSSTTIPPQLLQAYQGVSNAAQNFYGSTTPQNYSTDVNQFVAPLNSTQNAGINTINNASGQAQPYYGAATAGLQAAQNATTPYYGAATDQLAQGIGAGASGTQAAYAPLGAGLGAAGDLNSAAASNMGAAYNNAQPYNAAASQGTTSAQGVGAGLAGASLGALGQGQQQGQGYTQAGYNSAQPYNMAATGLAAAGAGPVNAQQIGSNQINQFESPYINDVTQSQLALLNQQNQTAMSGQTGNAIQSGAFGGDRAGIAAANLQQQQDIATNSILSNSLNSAYSQALGAAQQQQGVNLSAGQANRAAVQNASTQMQGIGQQEYTQGTGTGAQLFGQGATTASQLGALGQQQFGQGLSAAQEQAALGQQGYTQGMGLASGQQGLGAAEFGQGATASQQEAALAQQQFGQGVTGATTAAGLGQDVYGTGAATSAAMANLGAGAQSAALQGGQAQMAAGQTQQQTEQAGLQAMYNQWYQTNYGLPQSLLGSYAGAVEGIGQNEGSTTTTTTPGGLFSFLSDERAKENIKVVGKLHDGQSIYSYNYKGDPRTQIGLLAQEVEKKHPEAVGEANGWKTVDYAKATADSERARKAGGGGLDGGYDPSIWGQILSSQKGAYSGANSTAGGLGPVAPPNFAGTAYTAPQPGPHGGTPGSSTPPPKQQPGAAQQATQNNMTGLLQSGEAAAGKAGLGAVQSMMNPTVDLSTLPTVSDAAAASIPGTIADTTIPTIADAATPAITDAAAQTAADASATAIPDMLAMLALSTGGRAGRDTGGRIGKDPGGPVDGSLDPVYSRTQGPNGMQGAGIQNPDYDQGDQSSQQSVPMNGGISNGLAGAAINAVTSPEALMALAGTGVGKNIWDALQNNMGTPNTTGGNKGYSRQMGPTPSSTPAAPGLGGASTPAYNINPSRMSPGTFHAGDVMGYNNQDPSDWVSPSNAPAVGSTPSAGLAPSNMPSDQSQGEALASTAQAAATSANIAAGQIETAKGTAQKSEQHAANAEAARAGGGFHGIGDVLGGLGSAADGVVNAAAPGIGKAANTMTGGLAGAAANFGGNLIDGAKAGLGGYGHQLSQGDPNAWIPLLKGVGAMAAAPTRNWGTALTQGLAAGASAYYPTQQEQAGVKQTNTETQAMGMHAQDARLKTIHDMLLPGDKNGDYIVRAAPMGTPDEQTAEYMGVKYYITPRASLVHMPAGMASPGTAQSAPIVRNGTSVSIGPSDQTDADFAKNWHVAPSGNPNVTHDMAMAYNRNLDTQSDIDLKRSQDIIGNSHDNDVTQAQLAELGKRVNGLSQGTLTGSGAGFDARTTVANLASTAAKIFGIQVPQQANGDVNSAFVINKLREFAGLNAANAAGQHAGHVADALANVQPSGEPADPTALNPIISEMMVANQQKRDMSRYTAAYGQRYGTYAGVVDQFRKDMGNTYDNEGEALKKAFAKNPGQGKSLAEHLSSGDAATTAQVEKELGVGTGRYFSQGG